MDENKTLRSGFTTGTCAAACAGAAVFMLLSGRLPEKAQCTVPSGKKVEFKLEKACWEQSSAVCAVRKDAGDDPDVTNRTIILARASLSDGIRTRTGQAGRREIPCYEDDAYPGIFVTGGEGVGIVTKKGLSCPPGYYAINPVPRRMIMQEAELARRAAGHPQACVRIEICVPDGKRLALHTFNPNLGIYGGISILGTTGVVNPMSEKALLDTIRLDIRIRVADGNRILAVAPGNYGERFLRETEGLSAEQFVKCSNFVGETFRMLKEEGVKRVLLAGHPGKLIKVAGGVLNTHSKYGDRRMEILARCAGEEGVNEGIRNILRKLNTTEEAVDCLRREGCADRVFKRAAYRAKYVLEKKYGVETEVILFSTVYGCLAMTEYAEKFAAELRERV